MDLSISAPFDSVFDAFADTPFAEDALPINVDRVIAALDRIEQRSEAAMMGLLERGVERILAAAGPAIKAGSMSGIAELNWGVGVAMQAPIAQVWRSGWGLGSTHCIAEIRASIPPDDRPRFALSRAEREAIAQAFRLESLPIPSAVDRVILRRSINLAGDFAADQLGRLKLDLIAATVPDSSGKVLSREELLSRIEAGLGVGRGRAGAIAQTELTNSYNQSRVETAQQSSLVTHFRFLGIDDRRQTEICRSRNGLLIPADDSAAISVNQPSLHVRCRSVLSPVLGTINPTHAEWVADPQRSIAGRSLVPLPEGWRTAR